MERNRDRVIMKTKTIRQSVKFKVSPHEVYEALMNSKKHSKFTNSKATISREVGGRISTYDGYVDGTNLKIIPDKKIVQKWRGSDWPEDHYSTATFEFKKIPEGTELKFTQTEVPEEQFKPISEGWIEHYWDKMKKMLEKK